MSDDSSSDEDVSKFQEAVDIKLTEAFSKNTPSANSKYSNFYHCIVKEI
jgi:hypothetical protein